MNAAQLRRCGPRAPAGKKPLMVILDEDLIKASKIAAIEDGRNVSGIVRELLEGAINEKIPKMNRRGARVQPR
jgi:hypothetical protein